MRKEKQINPALGDLVFIAKDHVVIVLFGAQRSLSAQRKKLNAALRALFLWVLVLDCRY